MRVVFYVPHQRDIVSPQAGRVNAALDGRGRSMPHMQKTVAGRHFPSAPPRNVLSSPISHVVLAEFGEKYVLCAIVSHGRLPLYWVEPVPGGKGGDVPGRACGYDDRRSVAGRVWGCEVILRPTPCLRGFPVFRLPERPLSHNHGRPASCRRVRKHRPLRVAVRILPRLSTIRSQFERALPMIGVCLWGDGHFLLSTRPGTKASSTRDRTYVWASTL